MDIRTLGIDLAKNLFHIHGVDGKGRTVVQRQLRRRQLLPFIAQLRPCLMAMEACGGAHYWAREIALRGHEVRLMSPRLVRPYVKSNKNDARDAEAICEAVGRPSMRFVAVKSQAQQDMLALHRVRALLIRERTALINQMRGLLAEYGIVVAQGAIPLRRALPLLLEERDNGISELLRELLAEMSERLRWLEERLRRYDQRIAECARADERAGRLMAVAGVGPLIATALIAAVGDARQFHSGRDLSAWLGLMPRQHSSGGRSVLLGISKRGDRYLRTLLIHGARAALRFAARKRDHAAVGSKQLGNGAVRTSQQWHWPIRTRACFGRCSRAMRITASRPLPEQRAGEKPAQRRLRGLSAKLMVNRSDRHFANLSNCQGTKARSPDQEKVRGFPSWPGAQCGSFKRPDTRPQPEDQSKAATLRTGLGPYTSVRIHFPPPTSLSLTGHFRELRKIRACARDLPPHVDPERDVVGANPPNFANPLCARFPHVRPHKHVLKKCGGGALYVAELKIIKALKVLDLTRPEERVDNDGGILAALIYSSLMSAPRNGKAWNRPEYVFSRFVADCARHASFDAIKYPTTRASEGHNLVIINPRYGLRDVGKVLTITTIAEHL